MICPLCGKEGKDDSKFCGKCGKRIPRCPTCGRVLTKPMRFCLHDGTPIPEEIQSIFTEGAAPVIPVIPVEPVQVSGPAPAAAEGKSGKQGKKEKKKSRFLTVILIVLIGLLAGAAAGAAGYVVWQNWDLMPWVSDSAPEPSETEEIITTEEQPAESAGAEETLPVETTMPTDAAGETQPVVDTAPTATEPPATPVYVSTYEVIAGDLSWHEAKLACEERGGTLASINSAEEYKEICTYATNSGLRYLWLGACLYSAGDEWADATWLTGEPWGYEIWYPGEPSKEDADGTKEYYLCLWNAKYDDEEIGWTMNDQRSDIVADFPNVSGKIGYVCEYRVEVTG